MDIDHDIEMLKVLDQFLELSKTYVKEATDLLNKIHHTRFDQVEKQYFCFVRVTAAMNEKLGGMLNNAVAKGIKFRKEKVSTPVPTPSNVVKLPTRGRMLDLAD